MEIITELYVEVYWKLFRIFKNERIAAAIDLLLLIAFQLLNIYTLVALVQKGLSVDFTGYLFHQPLVIISICVVVALLNFFSGWSAKKTLKKEDAERYITQRFTIYSILSIALFVTAHWVSK